MKSFIIFFKLIMSLMMTIRVFFIFDEQQGKIFMPLASRNLSEGISENPSSIGRVPRHDR